MSDVKIMFYVGSKFVGEIESSLENLDAEKHIIPKRIVNKIRNTYSDQVEILISIEHRENNYNGGILNE